MRGSLDCRGFTEDIPVSFCEGLNTHDCQAGYRSDIMGSGHCGPGEIQEVGCVKREQEAVELRGWV